jgi:antitoxin component of RelBE/YafQ-DinJ toxin-antitoxin module
MPQVSARVDEDSDARIEAFADEHDLTRSEAIRELLRRGVEYDRVQTENDRLQRNLQQLIGQREEHTELVEYVEEERGIQQRREERRDAPLWRRARWFVFGRSDDGEAAD